MVEESTVATADPPADSESNTFMNSLLGAVITIMTAPVLPFAAIAGGGVAGYLQQGDVWEGAKVGTLSGLIATIPAFLLVWVVGGFLFIGADPLLALTTRFALVLFIAVLGYLIGVGALGGALGACLRSTT